MKPFRGKAIYQPTGKAAEYSPWACNFYTGCSNDCEYCYCKRGVMAHVWDNKPHLKKSLVSPNFALRIFCDEMFKNIKELRENGLLFSFTTDPLLPETKDLTLKAVEIAAQHGVRSKILTKRADFVDVVKETLKPYSRFIAFGFTLTGFDEKEPFADSNTDRIEAMKELHEMGFKTFASLEPVITPAMSFNMIRATQGFCDLYKVGLMSGRKIDYNRIYIDTFFKNLIALSKFEKIYLKDSFLDWFKIDRKECPGNFVGADYNIFGELPKRE